MISPAIRQQSRALPRPPQRGARARCARAAATSSGRRWRPSRRSSRATSACGIAWAWRTAPMRSRSRCRALGVGPGRRGGDAVVHLLRDRRGGARARRAAGLLRHRPRHVLRHAPRPSRRRSRRAPRRSCRCTCSGTSRRSRQLRELGVPVVEDAAQAAGAALGGTPARARSATSPRSRSSPRRTCPASATAAQSPRTTTSWPSGPGSCASTGRRTRSPSPTWAATRGSTSCRRRRCGCCCRSWTGGPSAAARRPSTYERLGMGEHAVLPRATDGAEHAYHLYVVRSERELPDRARLLPHAGAPPAGGRRPPRSCPPPRRPRAPTTPCRWERTSRRIRSARSSKHARLDRPDQQPPRARHAPADRGDAGGRARGGGHRARLRPDARAVRALRHRAHGDRPPPRRAARVQGGRARVAQRRAGALGARAPLRRGDRARLERRERGGRAAAHSGGHGLRLRVRRAAAPRELPPLPRGDGAGADPARAAGPLRREAGQAAPLRGPEGGVLPGGLRAGRGGARGARALRASGRSWWCERRRMCRSTTASRTRCSATVLERLAAERVSGGGAAADERAARGGARLWVRSSCRSTRWTPRASSRTPIS